MFLSIPKFRFGHVVRLTCFKDFKEYTVDVSMLIIFDKYWPRIRLSDVRRNFMLKPVEIVRT